MNNKISMFLIVLMSFSLSGCGTILAPVNSRDITYYELTNVDLPNLANCTGKQSDKILFIAPVQVGPPFDSNKMYYSKKQFELSTFSYSQWATVPSDMIIELIYQRLMTNCIYKEIVTSEALANADYNLITRVISMRQDIVGKKATVKLVISAQLINLSDSKVISSTTFDQSIPSKVGPRYMVTNMNTLINQFNQQLVVWLRANLK